VRHFGMRCRSCGGRGFSLAQTREVRPRRGAKATPQKRDGWLSFVGRNCETIFASTSRRHMYETACHWPYAEDLLSCARTFLPCFVHLPERKVRTSSSGRCTRRVRQALRDRRKAGMAGRELPKCRPHFNAHFILTTHDHSRPVEALHNTQVSLVDGRQFIQQLISKQRTLE